MTEFMELEQNELLSVDGGDFWESIGYASASYAAGTLSSVCFGAITSSAPAIAVAGCITGGVGFGAIALICGVGAVITLLD